MFLSRRRNKTTFLYSLGITILLYIIFKEFDDYWNQYISSHSCSKTFKILFYNPKLWFPKVNMKACEYSNCVISSDKAYLAESDAVIFHLTPLPSNPPKKYPKQKWVFCSLESAHYGRKTCTTPQWRHKFDWVMSHRRDSDFFFGYGDIITRREVVERNYEEIYRKKKKLVAWIVSHCNTQSKRERYVEEMSQIAKVDVYGACGNLKCGPSNPIENDDNDSCHEVISRDYKFYLSFENSLCTDYTTEKFYFIYADDRPIIPIVRGSFTFENYSRGAVYLDVNKFRTPQHLMRYLEALGSSKDAYIDLLRKKDKFSSLKKTQIFETAMCKMCKYLNLQKHGRTNLNIADWFFAARHCHSPYPITVTSKQENINLDKA
jgi:hypothetical protein